MAGRVTSCDKTNPHSTAYVDTPSRPMSYLPANKPYAACPPGQEIPRSRVQASCRQILDTLGSWEPSRSATAAEFNARNSNSPHVPCTKWIKVLTFTSFRASRGDAYICCGFVWHLKPRNSIQRCIWTGVHEYQRISLANSFFWFSRFSGKLKRLEAGTISGYLCSSIRSSAFDDTGLSQPLVEISLRSWSACCLPVRNAATAARVPVEGTMSPSLHDLGNSWAY